MKYLALGDSYTIGEQVDAALNFPSQLLKMLQPGSPAPLSPKIIAVTGWTTDELASAIEKERPGFDHDLVTLLIGVNNQYRGRSAEEYRWQFYSLLCQAILFAGSDPRKVIVFSIPDWGLTPFNRDRDAGDVSAAIDAFNKINLELSTALGVHYVDVTASTRLHARVPEYLAPDELHYSAEEYRLWAEKAAAILAYGAP